jgi:hypothetical protein
MKSKKLSSTNILIISIVAIVAVLVIIFAVIQNNYSTKIKNITVTANSGPVSPEFQQTQTISISKDSCEFTTVRTQSQQTTTEPCKVLAGKFEEIQKEAATYDLVGKVLANQKDSESDLLGGKEYTIQVTLNDGSTFKTVADNNFIQSLEPFFDNLNIYVPFFSRIGL